MLSPWFHWPNTPNVSVNYQDTLALPNPSQISDEGHLVWSPGYTFDHCGEYPAGRYCAIRLLGSGTYGKVVECIDQKHKARAAIKVIRRGITAYRLAAEREIRILRDLGGRFNTLKLLRDFEHSGHKCLVFDIYGENLRTLLDRRYHDLIRIICVCFLIHLIQERYAFRSGRYQGDDSSVAVSSCVHP